MCNNYYCYYRVYFITYVLYNCIINDELLIKILVDEYK